MLQGNYLKALIFSLCVTFATFDFAQNPPTSLVAGEISDAKLVTLPGNVHPLAQSRYDLGAVPDSLSVKHMLLLLNRPAERDAALQKFLVDVQTPGSAKYHKWLTPQEFGEQFGVADSDVQAATGWLGSHGFNVSRVMKGKQFIEFSGTAAQLREAFHTEIHQYSVQGETHYANSKEASIPTALATLVRGISPLNNFRAEPYVKVAGSALYSRATKKTTPMWTMPNPYGTANPYAYALVPEDFATQYDLAPLYQADVKGAGQTIGIINESNIDLGLVNAYQQLFKLPINPPQVVIDGDDPGTLDGVDVEAYLDVEVSGSVAPAAKVNLYIAEGGGLLDPLALAALRAIEDNEASVLSVSFGQCEVFLGNAGNQMWAGLWQQAAAQGQTVLVSAGDYGSQCEISASISSGLDSAVSGLASTPWNIAVGGTDFYYSDYLSGAASATTLWNQTNDSSLGSLKAPLTEQVWDDGYGLNVISDGLERNETGAGGGGQSNCSSMTQTSTGSACASGYAKPSWQVGPGVPSDGVRDLPDVSLFASNGANLSAYPICAYEGQCAVGTGGETGILLVGGTSASAPAMAGIMALVNQKYGRQGQANFTLYQLARQKPAAFHDVTLGNNFAPCLRGTQGCSVNGSSPLYPASANYDLASGLGSVDATELVNNWNSITAKPTATTLQLSATSITHGTPVTVTASVAPTSGTGTPTGDVAILTSAPLPASQAQAFITLAGGSGASSIDFFPGGFYEVSADYHGDGVFGSSISSPVALTVKPENSNINFLLVSESTALSAGGSVAYNAPLVLSIQPIGVSAAAGKTNGNATGTATFTVDSITRTVALNGAGAAIWMPPALPVGTHTASATYSGDASFNPSSAPPVTFNVTQGLVFLDENEIGPFTNPGYELDLDVGSTLTIGVTAQGWKTSVANPSQIPLGTAAPTGTVQVCLGLRGDLYSICMSPVYSQTVTLTAQSGANAHVSSGEATFSNLAAGYYHLTLLYGGDSNWGSEGLFVVRAINVESVAAAAPTTTTLSITPSSFSGTQTAIVTATVTGSGDAGTAPSGMVNFYGDGVLLAYAVFPTGVVGTTNSFSFEVNPSWFLNSGANQVTAMYQGGGGNAPSVSNVVNITAIQTGGDFTFAPQTPQIALQAGGSGRVGINLASLSSFNGVVNLTCTPSSSNITCTVDPSTLTLNGAATATVTINASAKTAGLTRPQRPGHAVWLGTPAVLAFAFIMVGGTVSRKRKRMLQIVFLMIGMSLIISCGGGGSAAQPQVPVTPAKPANGTAYSVVVSGTANGIVHNAKLSVIVQ